MAISRGECWPGFCRQWRRGLDLKNAAILGDVDLSGVQCPKGGISLEEAERSSAISSSGRAALANARPRRTWPWLD